MTVQRKPSPVSPFEDAVVAEPRYVGGSVPGLNDRALNVLLERFAELESGPVPRMIRPPRTQFVVSPQPGYGKSHLIGRLFQSLAGRAMPVYVRPFEDPGTGWASVLLNVIQELEFPYRGDGANPAHSPLSLFAHAVVIQLIVEALRTSPHRRSPGADATIDGLLGADISAFRTPYRRQWLAERREGIVNVCMRLPRRLDMRLSSSPATWVRALIVLAYYPDHSSAETVRDWLRAGVVDPEEARRAGIAPADLVSPELNGPGRSEIAKLRLQDLCQLAGFFRPFVFCFDQTDEYARTPELAAALGSMIQTLTDYTVNQMTVLTANQHVWSQAIRPRWQDAQADRLCPPLELPGVDRDRAASLIRLRLAGLSDGPGEASFPASLVSKGSTALLDEAWLDGLLPKSFNLGIRDFLRRCDDRWRSATGEAPADDSPEKAFQRELSRRDGRSVLFDPDLVFWLLREVGAGLDGVQAGPPDSTGANDDFLLEWRVGDRRILFGAETGSQWKRWGAIVREGRRRHDADPRLKLVFFRGPGMKPIPGPNWTSGMDIAAAKALFLDLVELTAEDLARFRAARDLCAEAGEGGLPFSRDRAGAFLRGRLADFWDRVLRAPASPASDGTSRGKSKSGRKSGVTPDAGARRRSRGEGDPLTRKVKALARRERLLRFEELRHELPDAAEADIRAAVEAIPEIETFSHPGMTVLLWRS